MQDEITWQKLSDLIKRQMFEPNVITMIHICDHGTQEEIFDIEIYPYQDGETKSFYMKKEDEDAYSKLYTNIKKIYPEELGMSISRDYNSGEYTLKITINRYVRININYYTEEGQKWLDNIYNGGNN